MSNDSISIRYIRRAGARQIPTLVLSTLALLIGSTAPTFAQAGQPPGEHRPASAQVAKAAPGAVADEGPFCIRTRKKLWVEGEGWIVRRVNMCR